VNSGVTWAASLEAWSTLAAAVAAIIAGVFGYRLFRTQSRQIASQQQFERRQAEVMNLQADEMRRASAAWLRAQADRIVVLSNVAVIEHGGRAIAGDLRIVNLSDLPIYDIRWFITFDDDPWPAQVDANDAPYLVAGDHAKAQLHVVSTNRDIGFLKAVALFRDHGGRWWRRGLYGSLEPAQRPQD
jgi:hypothetical protein